MRHWETRPGRKDLSLRLGPPVVKPGTESQKFAISKKLFEKRYGPE